MNDSENPWLLIKDIMLIQTSHKTKLKKLDAKKTQNFQLS